MAVKPAHIAIALLVLVTIGLSILLIVTYMDGTARQEVLKSQLNETKNQLRATENELNMVRAALNDRENEIALQKDEIANLTADLESKNDRIVELEAELNETQTELEEAQTTLQEAQQDIDAIRNETLAMDEAINQSIQWFTENSELPSTLKVDRFINKVEDGCEQGNTLNLACISYLMGSELGMVYKNDPTGDRLYSIEEIITRKGGDCEDFSLFFKALLNRFKGQDLELEAWERGIGSYTVYEDTAENMRWYYDNARGKALGNPEDLHPYAACYWNEIFGTTWGGHCIIMLTAANITSSSDINDANLADAVFFEPQDGKYKGRMDDEFNACADGNETCGEDTYKIVFVITDSDLYEFSDGRWNYYADYGDRLDDILADLDKIKTDDSSEGPGIPS
ncbi:hypothetical protein H0O00_00980 [Candidatus Micrarchaeota archaeon]|nr:hypothetical protein [Candidatus Micrarchaeota archaeon]